jgi:GNAT superfamily N-acetyltransferase
VRAAGEFHCEMLRASDRAQACDLLQQMRVNVGGLTGPALYNALVRDPAIAVVVVKDGETVAGIAVMEENRRWPLRHPWLLTLMAVRRIRSVFTRPRISDGAPVLAAPPLFPFETARPPLDWSDACPRTLFIGVAANYRGRGAGDLLYEFVFSMFRERGCPMLLARIGGDNVSSIKMHLRTGWRLYRADGGVLAVKALRP